MRTPPDPRSALRALRLSPCVMILAACSSTNPPATPSPPLAPLLSSAQAAPAMAEMRRPMVVDDPAMVDWRQTNDDMERLGGHVGQLRGTRRATQGDKP
jgi:hypothetical protein